MERAVAGDDAVFLRAAALVMVFAHHLDRALERLGARIAEEDGIGEGVGDEAGGEAVLARDGEEVRGVPELLELLGQGPRQMRVPSAADGGGEAWSHNDV